LSWQREFIFRKNMTDKENKTTITDPFQGIKHINYALVESTRPMMYKALKYWGKKPHNVFRKYIEAYTDKNEIVLDAFAGSGITPLEAIQAGRKTVAVDLNPVSTFMIEVTAKPLDYSKFGKHYSEILEKLIKKENELQVFITKCEKCKNTARVTGVHWDGDTPILIRYECSCTKGIQGKEPDNFDKEVIKKSEELKIPYWYPKDEFPKTDFFKAVRKGIGNSYYKLWTNRTLYLLSFLYKEIEDIDDEEIKDFLKFAFISMIHLATIMVSARRPKSKRPDSGSWGRPAFILPKRHMEQNPVILFQRSVEDRQGIIKAKKSSEKLLSGKVKIAKNFQELADEKKDKNLLILTIDALDLSKSVPENSIDYVITDPPYGGLIQYFSLSSLWAIWLKHNDPKFEIPYEDEITIEHKKDFERYHQLLTKALREIYKVLKPGHYLTLTFHNREINVWNSVIKAGAYSGFIFEKILFQPNKRASEAGVAMPYGSAISDYYLRFKKPEKASAKDHEAMGKEEYERIVVKAAKDIIAMRGEPTEMTFILNGIYTELFSTGRFFEGSHEDIVNILKENISKTFVLIESKGGKLGPKWWLKNPEDMLFKQVPLSDRVEKVVIDLLRGNIKVTFDEILQKLFISFPNGLTPDTKGVIEVLKEYATTTGDGRWRYKPEVHYRDSEHSEMIYYLSEIGRKAGYKVWIGSKEQGDTFQNEKLSKYCTESNLKLEGFTKDEMRRIEMIDVLWYDESSIKYVFEVENSTSITSAIERASHIPEKYDVQRFIVIPEERQKMMDRKMGEPMFQEGYTKYKWQTIHYDALKDFYNLHKGDKTLKRDDLRNLK
jgi:DNA modification methylase